MQAGQAKPAVVPQSIRGPNNTIESNSASWPSNISTDCYPNQSAGHNTKQEPTRASKCYPNQNSLVIQRRQKADQRIPSHSYMHTHAQHAPQGLRRRPLHFHITHVVAHQLCHLWNLKLSTIHETPHAGTSGHRAHGPISSHPGACWREESKFLRTLQWQRIRPTEISHIMSDP